MNKFELLDDVAYPALKKCVDAGYVAVLIGAAGTGKSVLSAKALPLATLITGRDEVFHAPSKMDSDLIGEELFRVAPEKFIKLRDQAIELGRRVIITGQAWQDVECHLTRLGAEKVRVFNLNRLLGMEEWMYPNTVPKLFPVIELRPPESVATQKATTQGNTKVKRPKTKQVAI